MVQQLPEHHAVKLVRVVVRVGVLVRLPEPWHGRNIELTVTYDQLTDEVRHDDPVPVTAEHGHHLAVEEGPGGLAVQAEHHAPLPGALVQVVHPRQLHPAPGVNAAAAIVSGAI